MRGRAGVLALACAVAGCAGLEPPARHRPHATSTAARAQREVEMNRQWQDKPLADLLAAMGKPRMVMSIPGGGMPPSFAVVYGVDAGSGCVDAFAVHAVGEPVIRIYHCR